MSSISFADKYWDKKIKSCVRGKNTKTIPGKIFNECKALCLGESNCKAFEFDVAYGGTKTEGNPKDYLLQRGNDFRRCGGVFRNLSLHVKKAKW